MIIPTHSANGKARRMAGFTLLEVLVALVVLSIGLLGLSGLQTTSLRNNHAAFLRSQATLLNNDIADRMRANRDSATAGNYNIDYAGTPTVVSCVGSCSAVQVAQIDVAEWRAYVERLPDDRAGRRTEVEARRVGLAERFAQRLEPALPLAEPVVEVTEVLEHRSVVRVFPGCPFQRLASLRVPPHPVVDPAERVQVGPVPGVGLQGLLDQGERFGQPLVPIRQTVAEEVERSCMAGVQLERRAQMGLGLVELPQPLVAQSGVVQRG